MRGLKLSALQIAAALAVLLSLSVATSWLGIDTNIDTGNNLAKGAFLLAFVWLCVATIGLLLSLVLMGIHRVRKGPAPTSPGDDV